MQPVIAPIQLNEQSPAVANLLAAVKSLGYPINAAEAEQQRAGAATLRIIRDLQLKNKLHYDDKLLVDEVTANWLNVLLKQMGSIHQQYKYQVSGHLSNQLGEGIGGKILEAYGVALKGARIYKTAKTIEEIKANGGMTLLGWARSQPDGSYTIHYNDDPTAIATNSLPDVLVYAVQDNRIAGLSKLTHEQDYTRENTLENIDIVLATGTDRGISEYTRLSQQVATFLQLNEVPLNELYDSSDQVSFVANELTQTPELVQQLVKASQAADSFPNEPQARALLFALSRQEKALSWSSLAAIPDSAFTEAWHTAIQQNIIDPIDDQVLTSFGAALHTMAVTRSLQTPDSPAAIGLTGALALATGDVKVQAAFLGAVQSFTGSPVDFWEKYLPQLPAFKEQPGLIPALQLTNQLVALTGNHLPLVQALQAPGKIKNAADLLMMNDQDWTDLLARTGVPDSTAGTTAAERIANYKAQLQTTLNAAFPTLRIASMIQGNQLHIPDANVKESLTAFFNQYPQYDISSSRIADFTGRLAQVAGKYKQDCIDQLASIQRLFQLSPTPGALSALVQAGLNSARQIANIPEQAFIDMHSAGVGGDDLALSVHQRATRQAMRMEHAYMTVHELTAGVIPKATTFSAQADSLLQVIQNNIPNYTQLFESPAICACEECRSVYGAAAYLVDILQFLDKCKPNDFTATPQAVLLSRRPDIAYLPLTCENTNTIIPYIDLVNEVMEYYVVNGKLDANAAHDTEDATAVELRANPQYTLQAAYKLLAESAVYPFGLPYHQALDAERTYFKQLHTSRTEVMEKMRNDPSATVDHAIHAEGLGLAPKEYVILTGKDLTGAAAGDPIWTYFGYPDDAGLQGDIYKVLSFLSRTGVLYTDLIALLDSRFINPDQPVLDNIEALFSGSALLPAAIYQKLKQVAAGTLVPSADPDLAAVLIANAISSNDLAAWVSAHFAGFQSVITLYQPTSACDLGTTQLRTLQNIYENLPPSGIGDAVFSRFHRFIRLWRKSGWSITDLDTLIFALGETDITDTLVDKLYLLGKITALINVPLARLAVCWGPISSFGNDTLYRTLFLNKALQRIDTVFQPDPWGNYLPDTTKLIKDHIPAILAAYRMTAADFNLVAADVAIDLNTAILSIDNLSMIYRYVVFSKAIGFSITDLCTLKSLFGIDPFSTYDPVQKKFISINLQATLDLITLATHIMDAGFAVNLLNYVIAGVADPNSNFALAEPVIQQTLLAIRQGFNAIDQDNPDNDLTQVTEDLLRTKMQLIFSQDVVERFLSLLNGTAIFFSITDSNLGIVIPAPLGSYVTYIKGSGRLQVTGVLSDDDRDTLTGLAGATGPYKSAVQDIYNQPGKFITDNFAALYPATLPAAIAALLDHPKHLNPLTTAAKWTAFYQVFLPYLKNQLRKNIVVQNVSASIFLDEPDTEILLDAQLGDLVHLLSQSGLSAGYYKDEVFGVLGVSRIDPTIDFFWQLGSPDPVTIATDHFSVRWEGWLNPPSSDDFTFVVEVEDVDDSFSLYLNDQLLFHKAPGAALLSMEAVATLSASKLYALKLEYVEQTGLAGIQLYLKTATGGKQKIDTSDLFPMTVYTSFAGKLTNFQRGGLFINGFDLKQVELAHLMAHPANFDNIDLTAPTAACWQRVYAYTVIRKSLPGSLASLTDLFELADRTSPSPTLDDVITLLLAVSGWNKDYTTWLVKTQFNFSVTDFRNEIAIGTLSDALQLIRKTGALPADLAAWAGIQTDFDILYDQSQLIKNTVKAQFEDSDWLQISKNLSNQLRENQKQALIQYLLVQPLLVNWGVVDADSLFEYFLIDVQMDACMDTSRIKQAISAVQLFVSRCLLNLESKPDVTKKETGVSPSQIDKSSRIRWAWMQSYRVWEANRLVFLYPENWLDPELRDDKTELFTALESELLQNDITTDSVADAFYGYLDGLDTIANLDICGMYEDDNNKMLHVFGRTHAKPYLYYYRTYDLTLLTWSSWQSVPVDVHGVDDGHNIDQSLSDSPNVGVDLAPVLWKDRLFIFWPEFMKKTNSNDAANKESIANTASNNTFSDIAATPYWEVSLAWSELKNGKWSTRNTASQVLVPGTVFILFYGKSVVAKLSTVFDAADFDDNLKNYSLIPTIDGSDRLSVSLIHNRTSNHGNFVLSDIRNAVSIVYDIGLPDTVSSSPYAGFFEKLERYAPLALRGNTYLQRSTDHKLLYSPQLTNFESTLNYPFFFMDPYRTYFVKPVDITVFKYVIGVVRQPSTAWYIPSQVAKYAVLTPQFPVVKVGPGDPVELGTKLPVVLPSNAAGRTLAVLPANAVAEDLVVPQANTVATNPSVQASYQVDTSTFKKQITGAFEGNATKYKFVGHTGYSFLVATKGLEFHTFFHPYTQNYLHYMNTGGIDSLMTADLLLPDDGGSFFEAAYQPVLADGFVQKPADFATKTYYKLNVAFDEDAAYSQYNWELFYHTPLYIATRLSKNGKYAEAMTWFQYIFDPTSSDPVDPANPESRYWKVLPFKTTPAESLETYFESLKPGVDDLHIDAWRDHPFNPYLIARGRPLAFMKNVVMKYIDNLISWGDDLYRINTIETINQATQLYVMAAHILGPRPQVVPQRGKIQAETYHSLQPDLDAFSNALVQMENLFPFTSEIPVSGNPYPGSMLGIGTTLYFCIPDNSKLLGYWDTIGQRLFDIRHCKNIEGVDQVLALFEPPIDPGLLIKATASGLSIGSILADLNSPAPFYRFSYLIQQTIDFCHEVISLGNSLLNALEKGDSEGLERLRSNQEINLLNLITEVRQRQVLEAKANLDTLNKSRDTLTARVNYYLALLGITDITVPGAPAPLPAAITGDSPLPADTGIPDVPLGIDVSLSDTDTTGVKIIPKEKEELDRTSDARDKQTQAANIEMTGSLLSIIPTVGIHIQPLGPGGSISFGGSNLGAAMSAWARSITNTSAGFTYDATRASKMGNFIRREQEWQQQAKQALKDIVQLDKQLVAADIRSQIAQKELKNHLQQLLNATDLEQFLETKFTSQEFYQWMKEQLFAVYKQSYQMAYDMAKKSEKAYQFELGQPATTFIQYGYFDSTYQGLTSGEQLMFAIRQLQKSFLEQNRREFELTKHVSMAMSAPQQLLQLRETGSCAFSLPEEIFDMDYPGHYFRRIKSVSISIPCVAGPYTTVNATLRLMGNSIRINTANGDDGYIHNNDSGVLTDDPRFIENNIPFTAIATSAGQGDSGLFELVFRDERYLPFEGAGVVSSWILELNGKYRQDDGTILDLSQFDYNSISDILLHLRYTSREDAGVFRQQALSHLKDYIKQTDDTAPAPFIRLFSLRHEFPTEWYSFLNQPALNGDQVFALGLTADRFPYFVNHGKFKISQLRLFSDFGAAAMPDLQVTSPGNTTNGYHFATLPDFGPLSVAGPKAPWNDEDAGAWKMINPAANAKLSDVNLKDIFVLVSYKVV